MKINASDIYALVDNELNPDDKKRVEAYIASSPPAGEFYARSLRQKALLKAWWKIWGPSH